MTFVLQTEKQYQASLRLHEMYQGMRERAKAHLKDLDGMIKDSSARIERYEKAHPIGEEGRSA